MSIISARTGGAGGWLYVPRPLPAPERRLFTWHYAGGSAQAFLSWEKRLPRGTELCAVQLPGRGERFNQAPFRSVELLLPELGRHLTPFLDLPFAFFGHSMGALLAFEFTRSLQKSGSPLPGHLFLSARSAPQIHRPDPPISELPDAEFLAGVERYGGSPETVAAQDPELMALLLPTVRADFALCESWSHREEAPLDIPLTIFGGRSDPKVDAQALDAWKVQTRAAFAVHRFAGGHFYLRECEEGVVEIINGSWRRGGSLRYR